MRAWLDAQFGARGVIQRNDLPPHLAPLGDGASGPRQPHVDARAAGRRDDPVAAVAVETDHAGAYGRGMRAESTREEHVVVGVIGVHVPENTGQRLIVENVRHAAQPKSRDGLVMWVCLNAGARPRG